MKQGWEIKKLGEVCDLQNGFAFKSSEYINFSNTMNFRMSQIRPGGGIDLENNPKYLPDEYAVKYKEYLLKEGDVVIAMTDMATETKILGVPTIVPKDARNWLLNQRVGKFINIEKSKIDVAFLKYILTSETINKYYKSLGRGGLQINIGKQDILNTKIPLCPLPEQKRIVVILDEAFAVIAKAKEKAENNLQNARELFESYLQSVFANPGEGWEEKKLGEVGETQTGTTPKTSDKENYGNYIPFITPADIDIFGDGTIRYRDEGLSEQGLENGRKMKKNSILMVCIGASIGKVGFVDRDVSCNQQINSLAVKKGFCSKFFYYALSTKGFFEQVIKNSAQATLPIINKGKWKKLTISYPTSEKERQSIVAKLDALSVETKKLEAIYQQKLTDLEELKKSILQKAFSGELAGACS